MFPKNRGAPKSSILNHFNKVFHCKPSVLGVFPPFLKTPMFALDKIGDTYPFFFFGGGGGMLRCFTWQRGPEKKMMVWFHPPVLFDDVDTGGR